MLATDVWPGLVAVYSTLIGVAPATALVHPNVGGGPDMPGVALKGLSEGEQPSIPESPWAWLMNGRGDLPPEMGSDLTLTKWTFNLRLMADWTNDPVNAERILMPILEQVRRVHQIGIKLGTTTVVMSKVTVVDWGYVPVDTIWYRSCDCSIDVSEKEIRNWQA